VPVLLAAVYGVMGGGEVGEQAHRILVNGVGQVPALEDAHHGDV